MLGASPDGLVARNALLELKWPFTQRDSTIEESVLSDNFYIQKNAEGHYEPKKEHAYWHQVQGQLHLSEREIYFICCMDNKRNPYSPNQERSCMG